MSDDSDTAPEAEYFFRGELARLRVKPDVYGQVVNNRNWDREYLLRIAAGPLTGSLIWFEDVELESVPTLDGGARSDIPAGEGAKIIDLATARTKGAA